MLKIAYGVQNDIIIMNPEYIYCLKNEEMPNICKYGGTADSLYNRRDQLSNTSLPVKCEVAYFIEVSD